MPVEARLFNPIQALYLIGESAHEIIEDFHMPQLEVDNTISSCLVPVERDHIRILNMLMMQNYGQELADNAAQFWSWWPCNPQSPVMRRTFQVGLVYPACGTPKSPTPVC
jgi:hypothetical protein